MHSEVATWRRRKATSNGRAARPQPENVFHEELDKWLVLPPPALARIVRDKRTLNIIYQIIELPLSSKEREQRDEIMEILVKSLNANIEDIDADPKVYLRTAMDKVIKALYVG